MLIRATTVEGYVTFWGEDAHQATPPSILGQRFDKDDNPVGSAFKVNSQQACNHSRPSVTPLGDDGFIVTWPNFCEDSGKISVSSVSGQCFDASGNKVGTEFSAHAETQFTEHAHTLLADYLKSIQPEDHTTNNRITSDLLSVVVYWDAD